MITRMVHYTKQVKVGEVGQELSVAIEVEEGDSVKAVMEQAKYMVDKGFDNPNIKEGGSPPSSQL